MPLRLLMPLSIGLVIVSAATTLAQEGAAGGAGAAANSPGRALVLSKCFQCHTDAMFRDQRQDRRAWEATIYRMVGRGALVDAGRDQPDGRLSRQRIRAGARSRAAAALIPIGRDDMRELVAQYLSHAISRRRFVNGLTKAGLTATAAQSVLASVTSVSLRARRRQRHRPGALCPGNARRRRRPPRRRPQSPV